VVVMSDEFDMRTESPSSLVERQIPSDTGTRYEKDTLKYLIVANQSQRVIFLSTTLLLIHLVFSFPISLLLLLCTHSYCLSFSAIFPSASYTISRILTLLKWLTPSLFSQS